MTKKRYLRRSMLCTVLAHILGWYLDEALVGTQLCTLLTVLAMGGFLLAKPDRWEPELPPIPEPPEEPESPEPQKHDGWRQ